MRLVLAPIALVVFLLAFSSCAREELHLEPDSIPGANVNVPYEASFHVTGGSGGDLRWRLVPGSRVPEGLQFEFRKRDAKLSGTPTEAGVFSFMLEVSSSSANGVAKTYTLLVDGGLAVVTETLPDASVQSAYSADIIAAGGTSAGYVWIVESGSLPNGLGLVSGTPSAILSGVPTTAGIYNFTVRVTDSNSATSTKPLQITVNGQLSISAPTPVPEPVVAQPYTLTLTASGGTGGYSWSVSQGLLPPGLSLVIVSPTTAEVNGTPSAGGNYLFTIRVQDSAMNEGVLGFNWLINAGLSITTASLPSGMIGASYFANVTATVGAGAPHSWSVIAGTLPPGITLTWSPVQPIASLSGVPTTQGSYNFTLQVVDNGSGIAARAFSADITAGALQITTASTPAGAPGVPYSATITGSDGSGTGYQWDVFGGVLPAGLSIAPTGTPSTTISGVPTTPGQYGFTIRLRDSATNTVTANFTIDVYSAGTAYSIAGTGVSGYNGDNKPALNAQLDKPAGVAADSLGNVYVADTYNHRIRRVDAATGNITTICGDGNPGSTGDGGPAVNARLNYPRGLWIDAANNIYIADSANHVVRRINASNTVISRIAGTYVAGFSGDNGQATLAQLNNPQSLCVAPNGDLYIADTENFRVRKVAAGSGVITTFAGNGTAVHSGDFGQATAAGFNYVSSVAVDSAGRVVIGEVYYYIRRVDSGGVITTIAGVAGGGSGGDGGPATQAGMVYVDSIHIDAADNIYISDFGRVRRINAANGNMEMVSTSVGRPVGLWSEASGHLLVADYSGSLIHRIVSP
ncbi:MAG: hypothetical protein KDB68_02500 [Planctomycetes bacterium]|nr:hypothetical protein [Planctomycetota bacterium]